MVLAIVGVLRYTRVVCVCVCVHMFELQVQVNVQFSGIVCFLRDSIDYIVLPYKRKIIIMQFST